MSVIAVERIKLFSPRSPWWCMIVAAVLSIGLASLFTGFIKSDEEQQATIFITQGGAQLSQMVMMVMAALAVTTEYRFGTIRTSFQAVPQRAALLLGKTAVVAFLAGVVGLIASFGGWAIGNLFVTSDALAIDTAAEWRLLAGQGLVFAVSAVIAVAIGILIRQSAGAIAILILWPLLVENLVAGLLHVAGSEHPAKLLPYISGFQLAVAGSGEGDVLGRVAGGLYFGAVVLALLALGAAVTLRRDA
jgi:ABC-2 type transport system permease protein